METKAAQSAADLDAARCRGDWSAVPDLAKHYKKYHPDESVLEATASIEAEFAQIVERQRRLLRQKAGEKYPDHVDDQVVDSLDQRWRSTTTQGQQTVDEPEYQHDGPEKITLSVRLTNGHCQTTQQKLSDIIKRKYSSESPDEWQAQFTKIILARVYFESGRYKEALEALQNLALRLEDATSGYGLVLLVQARTVKGVCYEMQGDIKAAEDAYEGAWNAVEQYNDEMSDMLIYWIEESLYRGSLLCLRSSDQWGKALRLLRAYSKLASSPQWPKNWRLYKQWVIHRYYAKLLVDLHRRESYIPQSQGKNNKEAALEELTQLLGQSRKLLTTLSLRQIPPKTLAKFTVDLANTIVEAHDTVGWGTATNIRRVLQFLYRAKEWTFNTTCIVRYLLLVLIRHGDHAEAVHAFGAYLTLIDIPDLLKSETDDIPNPNVATAKIKKKLGVLHRVDDTDEAQQDETIIDIIQTLTVGAELYGKDMENGRSAAIIASVALDLCENENQDNFLQVKCYQIAGVSYGVLAAQTSDPDTRSKYQQQAVQYLRQATKLDDKAWQALYELAVQQAITRDVVAAASTAMRSIQLKRDHLPSWNLLALVYSCKHFYQTQQALQTLAAGLAQTDILEKTFQVNSDTPAVSWSNDEEYSQAYFYAAEAYLQSKISQIHLLESTEGSEAVLNLYTELFTVYAKFSQQLGLGYGDDALLADPVSTPASMNSDNGYFSNLPESQSTLTSLSRRSSRSRSISIYDRRRSNSTSMPPSSRRPSEQLRQNSMTDTPPLSPSANGTNGSSIAATRKLKTSTSEETKSARTPTTEKPPPLEKHQRVSQLTRETKSIRKRSLQLMELGLARRIGNAQQSSRDDSTITPRDNSSPSLSSLLAPAYSVSSRRSSRTNSVSIEYRDAPLQRTNSFMQYQRERWYQILTKLWLMSTACFVRAGRLEEATKAVVEAEQQLLDGRINDAGVWHQMGKICLLKAQESGEKELHDTGLEAWRKALSIDPEHVDTSVDLAKYYIDHDEWELAEGLLDRATQGRGWDNAKAWYLLSECYRHNDNPERAKDCLLYALELDDTTPIQPFTLLPRFV